MGKLCNRLRVLKVTTTVFMNVRSETRSRTRHTSNSLLDCLVEMMPIFDKTLLKVIADRHISIQYVPDFGIDQVKVWAAGWRWPQLG